MGSWSIRWRGNGERSRAPCLRHTLFPRKGFSRARDEPSMVDISSLGINIVSAIDQPLTISLSANSRISENDLKKDGCSTSWATKAQRSRAPDESSQNIYAVLTPDKLAVSWKLSVPACANMTSENRESIYLKEYASFLWMKKYRHFIEIPWNVYPRFRIWIINYIIIRI